MLNYSAKNLEDRLQNYPAYVTTNNAYQHFNIFLPDECFGHWAAHISPLFRKSLAVFEENNDLKSLTFAQLKEKEPNVYRDSMQALDFIVRFGGRV